MRRRIIVALTALGTLGFVAAVGFAHNDLWWMREGPEGVLDGLLKGDPKGRPSEQGHGAISSFQGPRVTL